VAGTLHPAENRALRELYATTHQLAEHWERLADWLSDADPETADALASGARLAVRVHAELAEITPAYGLFGSPAARGVGARLADARKLVADRFLERNQSVRLAVLDGHHVGTLLGYLAELADHRGDSSLAEFHRGARSRIDRATNRVRKAAIALGGRPDGAIRPVDPSPAGRAGQRAASTAGAVGEWIDRRGRG